MTATIALAGNPNAGKTTLFNFLTGARQHVGNYPGVTVERKEGTYCDEERVFHIVDLPGIYSLTAYSMEEVVARNYLVHGKPAVVIDIVDASNLERNLYLTIQLLEMGLPVVIALNMMDVAKTRGMQIDVETLSKRLGVPVVPMVARHGTGKSEVMVEAEKLASLTGPRPRLKISYGPDVDGTLDELKDLIIKNGFLKDVYPSLWVALKYLESDEQIMAAGRQENPSLHKILVQKLNRLSEHLQKTLGTYPEAVIADHRYGYVKSLCSKGAVSRDHQQGRIYVSDRIDQVVTNRFAGPLIMAAVIWGLYRFVFAVSEIPVSWLETLFGCTGELATTWLPEGVFRSLIVSGIIDGVGGVLGFVPLIMLMFFGISILEDSGYLARIAFMLDRVFRIFGLHGNSVMAFIVSGGIAGGCAVPGVMATRTLKSKRERLATLLTVPFMNCGAKLPVFALLVGAFFSEKKAIFMFAITLIAWAGALLVARLFRSTLIRGVSEPFVMELPPYRIPSFRGLAIHTWERTWQYIKKAGTIVLSISILLWGMMSFPGLPDSETNRFNQMRNQLRENHHTKANPGPAVLKAASDTLKSALRVVDAAEAEAALKHSLAGRIGAALESISRWAGFDWRTNIALVGGFAAKEVIVSTLGTAYSLGDVDPENSEALSEKLANASNWRPLNALSLIIFVMFYAPCFVATVCISREAGSWKWGAFSMGFNTLFAFLLATLIFQAGSLLGF